MNILFDFISSLLENVNSLIGDWGLTIVVVTLLIKIVLMPFSIKQKKSAKQQQQMSIEMNELKEKYKDQKEKLEEEMTKLTAKYSGSMLGCMVGFLQLPILITLYKVISSMPLEMMTSILTPWVQNIKSPDVYYIIPLISCMMQLLPSLLGYLNTFSYLELPKLNKATLIMTLLINGLVVSQSPVIIGIYFIISSVCSMIEQVIYGVMQYKKNISF